MPVDSPLACVTGATGGLGRALVDKLTSESVRVVGTSLHGPDQVMSAKLQRSHRGDVTEADWPRVIQDCSVVFHLAAFVHKIPRTADDERCVYAVNTESTARLATACREAGSVLVFVSTVAVFGAGAGRRIGDDCTTAPATPYAKSKWESEEILREEGKKGLRFVILRFPLLYGPHGRGNMERLLEAIARRRYWPVGDQTAKKSCLSLKDAAEASYRAWLTSAAFGKTFVVAPEQTPTLFQIHDAAYRSLGRVMPRPWLTRGMACQVARVVDRGAGLLGRRTRFADRVRALTESTDFDGARFAAVTGFRPAVDLGTGFAETVRWLQSRRRYPSEPLRSPG